MVGVYQIDVMVLGGPIPFDKGILGLGPISMIYIIWDPNDC